MRLIVPALQRVADLARRHADHDEDLASAIQEWRLAEEEAEQRRARTSGARSQLRRLRSAINADAWQFQQVLFDWM